MDDVKTTFNSFYSQFQEEKRVYDRDKAREKNQKVSDDIRKKYNYPNGRNSRR